MTDKLQLAVICASNQNRSMEAHALLSKKGFKVRSFGTGREVKLPGPSMDRPNVYAFGTPYEDIFEDLKKKDPKLYTQNGVLNMLDRNRRIKRAPERFKDATDMFDLIICCEERCFDQVMEDLSERPANEGKPVHVINIDIRDNHEDAVDGARNILLLCRMLSEADDLEDDIEGILERFQQESSVTCLHSVAFY